MMLINYGADEKYKTPNTVQAPQYENAKQIKIGQRRLTGFYAYNSSGATVYLAVMDSADGGVTVDSMCVYPVYADSFLSEGIHGGERCEKGIYFKAFTDKACTTAAGNVMFYKVWFTAYH